ncbi:MAG TPA: FapA family protein [Polyangiaceae bacterium]
MPTPRLQFRIAEDGLEAFVSVSPGAALLPGDFTAAISDYGIVSGVIETTKTLLDEALHDPNFVCAEEVLARGRSPRPAEDAWFEPAFAEGLQAGHVRDDGSVDFHDRELLKPVITGDRLGILHAQAFGAEGQRVDGVVVKVNEPRAFTLTLMAGVKLDVDGCVLAAREGVVLYKAGQCLDVVERHEHRGPVDLHSGDLNMQGSLVVKGDVTRPFAVAATGDIEIYGNIASASVLAGGNLRVQGGIRGGDGGIVCAEGDMRLHHVEMAELHCGGQLQVQEAINSQLVAHEIRAERRLRGGCATAETRIIVNEVGAQSGISTRLAVGEPLTLPIVEAKRAILAAKSARAALRRAGRDNEREKGGKAGRARAALTADELQRAAEHAKRKESLLDSASVQVVLAHPGVEIRIGEAHVTLDAPARAARYSFDRDTGRLRCERSEA